MLASICVASAQTTNSSNTTNGITKTNTMSYKLTFFDSQQTISNPTEADIRAAVTSHKDDFGPIFIIGLDETKGFIRVVAEQDSHFSFQYTVDGSVVYVSTKETFSIEDAVKVSATYKNGSADWKKMVDWKELK